LIARNLLPYPFKKGATNLMRGGRGLKEYLPINDREAKGMITTHPKKGDTKLFRTSLGIPERFHKKKDFT